MTKKISKKLQQPLMQLTDQIGMKVLEDCANKIKKIQKNPRNKLTESFIKDKIWERTKKLYKTHTGKNLRNINKFINTLLTNNGQKALKKSDKIKSSEYKDIMYKIFYKKLKQTKDNNIKVILGYLNNKNNKKDKSIILEELKRACQAGNRDWFDKQLKEGNLTPEDITPEHISIANRNNQEFFESRLLYVQKQAIDKKNPKAKSPHFYKDYCKKCGREKFIHRSDPDGYCEACDGYGLNH